MMAITHATISVAVSSFLLGTSSPSVLCLSILGSQLPDLDSTSTYIGKACYPVARWIENRYPHRSLTHSFLFCLGLLALSLPLGLLWGWQYLLALPLGHLAAIISDTFTKKGVQLFWPNPVWCICGSNPNARLSTGSTAEYWVLAFAMLALTLSINLQGNGGLMLEVDRIFGLPEGVVTLYNQQGNTRHIYAAIEGTLTSDRSPVQGNFWIVAADGDKLIVVSREGKLYRTQDQILIKRITGHAGEPASVKVQSLTFQEEDLAPALESFSQSNKDSVILISGSVSVDASEEIQIPPAVGVLQAISITGDTVTFNHCFINEAIATLSDQFGSGTLQAKIFFPAPSFAKN